VVEASSVSGEQEVMLDSFIIEEIRRRERMRDERNRPVVELPLPSPEEQDRPPRRSENDGEDKPQRGVVVIDLAVRSR